MTLTLVIILILLLGHIKRIWCPTVRIINFTEVTLTLVLKLDLDMVKMYHHAKNKASMSRHSKVIARTQIDTHRQTHRQFENITFPHTLAVMINTFVPLLYIATRQDLWNMWSHLLSLNTGSSSPLPFSDIPDSLSESQHIQQSYKK